MKPIKDLDPSLIGHLDHFIDQGKWPLRVTKLESNLIKKHLPFLVVTKLKPKDSYFDTNIKKYRDYQVTLGKKGIPAEVLAAYWEFRYKEENERCEQIYNQVKQIAENF